MNSYDMKPKSRELRHNHKAETDRYEFDWHEIPDFDGEFTIRRTVWATRTTFGYDSNHIDFFEKRENRAIVIENENNRAITNYKYGNSAEKAKFEP